MSSCRTLVAVLALAGAARAGYLPWLAATTADHLTDSWGYAREPSALALAGDGCRLPLLSAGGRRCGVLRYSSRAGGDWGLAVARTGWPPRDLMGDRRLLLWLDAPRAIPPESLPAVALEDTQNRKSTRVDLAAVVAGIDDDPATWQKVEIPLEQFAPGAEGWDRRAVKTVYFLQSRVDAEQHELWVGGIGVSDRDEAPPPPVAPGDLVARGAELRVDLAWAPVGGALGYRVERARAADGPFEPTAPVAHEWPLASDFLGEPGLTAWYRVVALGEEELESPPSAAVSGTTKELTDEGLLDSIQHAAFQYFWDYGHPISGLARERTGSGDTCAIGGTGFGLASIVVGAARGWVTREAAAARVLRALTFLGDRCERYHGAWSHWVDGATGATLPFSDRDDGGDLVETAFLIQGVLIARAYFDRDTAVEAELRARAGGLWEGIEWDWYRRDEGRWLYWHWSPRWGWATNMPVVGPNEALMVYLLAIASPTHPVPASLYADGWQGGPGYRCDETLFGFRRWLGPPGGGPLFFTQYSYVGFDPHGRDAVCHHYENHRATTLAQRAYAIANPGGHAGYGENVWGISAGDGPDGYRARAPYAGDDGTITPGVTAGAMVYAPREALAALRHIYVCYGRRLWSAFGFTDGFNIGRDWYAESVLAIDQGPMAPLIENHRSGLCWRLFTSDPQIQAMLRAIGWRAGE